MLPADVGRKRTFTVVGGVRRDREGLGLAGDEEELVRVLPEIVRLVTSIGAVPLLVSVATRSSVVRCWLAENTNRLERPSTSSGAVTLSAAPLIGSHAGLRRRNERERRHRQ